MALLNSANSGFMNNPLFWVVYIVFFGGLFYFMSYKPQKKEKEKKAALMASMAVGDTVLTTAGFYGILIDITDDMVIVEFGNNKNCRIPMRREAIVEIEKPENQS